MEESKALPSAFPYKMWILVNHDLRMGPGKIGAQVGHAVADWTRRFERRLTDLNLTEAYELWVKSQEPKIVLKCTEAEMRSLRSKYEDITNEIHDAGKTQIPAGSLTVVAFAPMHVDRMPKELTLLKLL